MLMLLFLILLAVVLYSRPVMATSNAVYIRADGSIEPQTAPVSTLNNVTYALTASLHGSLVIERNNIVFDGAGYRIEGDGTGNGTDLSGRSNVTITDTSIDNFTVGIMLISSSDCTVSKNNVSNNTAFGFFFLSSVDNNVFLNTVSTDYNGIELEKSSNNTVSANNITDNVLGFSLDSSSNNTLSGNNLTDNGDGIEISLSDNNTALGNVLTSNGEGITLDSSQHNRLRDNVMTDNTGNFGVSGDEFPYFVNDVDASNTVDGKPIYYWINVRNAAVPSDAGCVILANCTGITVQGLNITNSKEAILLAYTKKTAVTQNTITNGLFDEGIWLEHSLGDTVSGNNVTGGLDGIWLVLACENDTVSGNYVTGNNKAGIGVVFSGYDSVSGNSVTNNEFGISLGDEISSIISGNTAMNNTVGILLQFASDNTIYGNNLTNNSVSPSLSPAGMVFEGSSDNKVYHNNFVDNAVQATADDESVNVWDDGYPIGGNYWSDYNGTDLHSGPNQNEPGSDWIGDTPYVINQKNTDRYPLMQPFTPETEEAHIAYRNLLVEYNGLNASYSQLLSNYDKLQASFDDLNETLQTQIQNYVELQTNYTSLQSLYSQAVSATNALQKAYDTLNASYNQLKSKQESTQNTLNNLQNTAYVITAMLAILIIAVVYLAVRRPKTKP